MYKFIEVCTHTYTHTHIHTYTHTHTHINTHTHTHTHTHIHTGIEVVNAVRNPFTHTHSNLSALHTSKVLRPRSASKQIFSVAV